MNKEGLSNEAKLAVQSAHEVKKLRRSYWFFKFMQILAAILVTYMAFWFGHDYGARKLSEGQMWLINIWLIPSLVFVVVFTLSLKTESLCVTLKDWGHNDA